MVLSSSVDGEAGAAGVYYWNDKIIIGNQEKRLSICMVIERLKEDYFLKKRGNVENSFL
ncbi:hypothetical protein QDZ26_001545 [Pluralibacter gergoviae]|nr:hypothetical protein [Pluralibacter gergoviae]